LTPSKAGFVLPGHRAGWKGREVNSATQTVNEWVTGQSRERFRALVAGMTWNEVAELASDLKFNLTECDEAIFKKACMSGIDLDAVRLPDDFNPDLLLCTDPDEVRERLQELRKVIRHLDAFLGKLPVELQPDLVAYAARLAGGICWTLVDEAEIAAGVRKEPCDRSTNHFYEPALIAA